MNKLLKTAATNWIKGMEEMYGWYTGRSEKRVLEYLYINHLVYMDDDAIDTIEQFICDRVKYGSLYDIYIYEQYLYCSHTIDEVSVRYEKINGINLKSLHKFSGKSNVEPKGNSMFWSTLYPHLTKLLSQIVESNADDEDVFIKQGDKLHFSTWTGFGSPAWYDIDISTGKYEYDFVED